MESVKARQMRDGVCSEIKSVNRELQKTNSLMDLFGLKAARFDEQVNFFE